MTEPLPEEDTLRLISLAQKGSRGAMNELMERNMGLVRSIALRFRGRGAEQDDLVQIGCMGFLKAVERFDPEYGTAFSTYAVPLISGEIKRFLRDDGSIKVSRKLKELAARITKFTAETLSLGKPAPRICEIAAALEAEPSDIAAAMEATRPCLSLNEPVFSEDAQTELADTLIASCPMDDPALDRVFAAELLSKLEPNERKLIYYRFYKDMTQTETAGKLCISQVRVSRAEARILSKLRVSANE